MSSEKYIGLDVHQATISVAVMDSQGKIIMESILETKDADCHDQCPMRRRYNLMRRTTGVKSWTVKLERSYMRRKLRPQKQWDGTQGLLRVWRQHRNIEKKWIDFRENWRKLAWITHTTKSSASCASATEVLAWAPMWVTDLGFASIELSLLLHLQDDGTLQVQSANLGAQRLSVFPIGPVFIS
jgi:hypothetical protein